MASTKQINEYLNKNEDINDRVQKIINSIDKENTSDVAVNNVYTYDNCDSNAQNSTLATKKNKYDKEMLLSYYQNLTDDEKNNLVSFVNSDISRIRKNNFKSVVATILVYCLNIIKCVGTVFASVLFSKSVVDKMYRAGVCEDVKNIDNTVNVKNGGDVNVQQNN